MAETKTEKAKEKATEMKNKVNETTEVAEKKVKESVKKTENSAVGQHIPTSLDSLTFKDIIKLTLLLNAAFTVGLYVIVSATAIDITPRLRRICLEAAKFIILIFGVGGIITDAVFFFGHLFSLFRVFLMLKLVKLGGIVLLCFAQKLGAWHIIIMSCMYMVFCIFIDLCYIYYLAIFQERMESEDYDENGMLKRSGNAKEEV